MKKPLLILGAVAVGGYLLFNHAPKRTRRKMLGMVGKETLLLLAFAGVTWYFKNRAQKAIQEAANANLPENAPAAGGIVAPAIGLSGLGAPRMVVTRGGKPVDAGLNISQYTGGKIYATGDSSVKADIEAAIGPNPGYGKPGYWQWLDRFNAAKREYTYAFEDGTEYTPNVFRTTMVGR